VFFIFLNKNILSNLAIILPIFLFYNIQHNFQVENMAGVPKFAFELGQASCQCEFLSTGENLH